MLTNSAMRNDFIRKVNVLKRKKGEKEKKKAVSCIDANKILVHNWMENQHAKKRQMAFTKEHRLSMCKKRREVSLEIKR